MFQELSEALAGAVTQTSQFVVTVRSGRSISGVVVADNEILTVAHVLRGDEAQILTPDGRELTAQVVGRQHASDLALLRVPDLNVLPVTASQGVRVGELLSVVARPAGRAAAALGFLGAEPPQHGFMPTGAAPFRGVSGGGVFDARGGLVGMANAGLSRGELLAVPAERALKLAALLSRDGRVPRGYLGIGTQPVRFPEDQEGGGRGPAGGRPEVEHSAGHGAGHGRSHPGPGRGEGSWGAGGWGAGGRGRSGPRGWNDAAAHAGARSA